MPFNTNHKIQIVDASGTACDDDDGALKVKLSASDDINIGNVVLQNDAGTDIYTASADGDSSPDLDGRLLLGTHALLSARSNVNDTLGITAEDSTHNALHVAISDGVGIANVDGSNNLNVILASNSGVDIGDVDVASIVPGTGATNLGKEEDAQHSSGDTGVMALAVRLDIAGALAGTSNDYSPLQVNAEGSLRVESYINVATGTQEAFNLGGGTVASAQYGQVPLVKRNDTLAVAHATHGDGEWTYIQTNAQGALYTTHGITGGADGATTDDTSGTVLGGDVACKKIDIQAQTDNTGVIAIGFTGVDSTVATGTGILLNAGDTYSLEINNLNLIYIDASVSGEGVRYTYFT